MLHGALGPQSSLLQQGHETFEGAAGADACQRFHRKFNAVTHLLMGRRNGLDRPRIRKIPQRQDRSAFGRSSIPAL